MNPNEELLPVWRCRCGHFHWVWSPPSLCPLKKSAIAAVLSNKSRKVGDQVAFGHQKHTLMD